MILISACLIGENVRYDGSNKFNAELKKLIDKGVAKAICPEILGGDGFDVLNNKAQVIDIDGKNVTDLYVNGARNALNICKKLNCNTLIVKSDSPTCSSQDIYSGQFNGTKKKGVGIFTALLTNNGIQVYDERNYIL